VSDSIPVDDIKIEMEGAVRLPDDALATVIAELTAWRNLAHSAETIIGKGTMGHTQRKAWLDEYARLTRG